MNPLIPISLNTVLSHPIDKEQHPITPIAAYASVFPWDGSKWQRARPWPSFAGRREKQFLSGEFGFRPYQAAREKNTPVV